jgi:hypothetical protein
MQVLKAMNVLYLDCDFKFSKDISSNDYITKTSSLMTKYLLTWTAQLKDKCKFYWMKFIPNVYPNGKGGFHIFIFMDKNMSVDDRKELYGIVRAKMDE